MEWSGGWGDGGVGWWGWAGRCSKENKIKRKNTRKNAIPTATPSPPPHPAISLRHLPPKSHQTPYNSIAPPFTPPTGTGKGNVQVPCAQTVHLPPTTTQHLSPPPCSSTVTPYTPGRSRCPHAVATAARTLLGSRHAEPTSAGHLLALHPPPPPSLPHPRTCNAPQTPR